jgi:hypothetical protein
LRTSKPITEENRDNGKFWEDVLFKRAQMNGLLPQKNHLTARYIYKNKYKVMKSQLDLTLITNDGKVGFFDAKSFNGDKFAYSALNPQQIERAALYNEWEVQSGFVVLFRKMNRICFFSGRAIVLGGPRTSFSSLDGLFLGRLESFDLRRLFKDLT